jgi:hypothetical protein
MYSLTPYKIIFGSKSTTIGKKSGVLKKKSFKVPPVCPCLLIVLHLLYVSGNAMFNH